MSKPPEFLTQPIELADVQGWHQPMISNRRGELLAWFSALGATVGSGILAWRLGQMPTLGLTAIVLFGLAALLISFGNWVERNTRLLVEEEVVKFESPLRKVELGWGQVESMRVFPVNQGWKIQVVSGDQAFRFQSAGRLHFANIEEMGLGIPAGQQIAAFIRQRSGLDQIHREDGGWLCVGR